VRCDLAPFAWANLQAHSWGVQEDADAKSSPTGGDGIIVRKDMSDLVLHNNEQLLRWPFPLGTSYEVDLFQFIVLNRKS
jgi:hypothetical protein